MTAWEAFIEDTLREQFTKRIDFANTPDDVKEAFISLAKSWFDIGSKRPEKFNPKSLYDWTGVEWKRKLLGKI